MDYCKPRGRQHSEDVHLSEGLSGFGTDSQWRDVDLAVVEMLREPVGTSITHTHIRAQIGQPRDCNNSFPLLFHLHRFEVLRV